MAGNKTPLFVRNQKGGMFTVVGEDHLPGDIWFVGSSKTLAGDTAGKGQNPEAPFATLDYAIGQATSDQGDVIFVLPGHAETLTADITVDKSDLRIIGLGLMGNRPTFTYGAAAREINVTADDVLLKNLKLVSDANNLVNFIDADANSLVLEDLWMETSSAKEAYCFIDFATTKDNLVIRRCHARQPTDPEGTGAAAGTGFLYFVDTENILVEGCTIIGNFETAIFHNKTTAGKDLWIKDTYLRQELSGAFHFVLVDGQTGAIERSSGHNFNADDVTVAKIVGTIGTKFWLGLDASFSNDSGGGGQLMVAGDAATT